MVGFETRNEEDEGLFIFDTSLTFTTSTADLAPQTKGEVYAYAPLSRGYAKPLTHSVSECWVSALVHGYNVASDCALGLLKSPAVGTNSSNREFTGVFMQDNTMRVKVGASTKTSAVNVPVGNWTRVHIHISGRVAGSTVRAYFGGDLSSPVLEYTLDASDEAALAAGDFDQLYFMSSATYFDDIYAIDPSDGVGLTNINRAKALSVVLRKPIANGAGFSFSSGTFADVDETPTNFDDYVEATAVGQALDLEFEDLDPAQVVGALEVVYRTQLADSTAGDKFDISIDNGSTNNVLHTNVTIPGDSYVRKLIHEAADGGSLEVSKINASTLKAVTKS